MSSGGLWRAIVPLLVLVAVAGNQVRLARTRQLSPWKGGGFGMFSTTDSPGSRRVRIVVHGGEGSREIEVPARLTKSAAKTVILPTGPRLERFAAAVADDERRQRREVTGIDLEVWAREVAVVTLFTTERRLAVLRYRPPALPRDDG